jgi:hypothetical protein
MGGLLVRKERWGLSWRARLVIVSLGLGLAAVVLKGIHPFLAARDVVPARLLVIEGWSPPATMREVAAEFSRGHYDQAVLIRPVLDAGDQYESGRYSGHWMARLVVEDGIPDAKLTALFPNVAKKDRTYHSALAVKQWAAGRGMNLDALNVATSGPHARRSRLLYEKAFGPGTRIGVIGLEPLEYDPAHWWRTSEGVREVIGETIAYVYARFFFYPGGQ